MDVQEIRVGLLDGQLTVALLAPNGHPVNVQPWFVVVPETATPLGEGTDWVGENAVEDWVVIADENLLDDWAGGGSQGSEVDRGPRS